MTKVKVSRSSDEYSPMKPALTPESQENTMIALAMNLVQKRLVEGTASSQETTHFLKLATVKYQLEKEKLRSENELLTAKKDAINRQAETSVIYEEALKAMRTYSGNGDPDDY